MEGVATWDANGLLRVDGRLVVPNWRNLRRKILRGRHDQVYLAHLGHDRTFKLVARDFVWLGMQNDVNKYVTTCAICQRMKTRRHRPYGDLWSLEVAS